MTDLNTEKTTLDPNLQADLYEDEIARIEMEKARIAYVKAHLPWQRQSK